jgi:hypothetical protein
MDEIIINVHYEHLNPCDENQITQKLIKLPN